MRLTIAYSKTKQRNLVLINNDTHQRETLSERPIRPPLSTLIHVTVLQTINKPTNTQYLKPIFPWKIYRDP